MPEPAHAYVELLAAAPARLLAYAAILLTVGAAVWRLWVLPRSAHAVAAAPEAFARARQAVTFVGALAGAGGVVASAWQLSAQLATLGDPADPGGGAPMMGALVLHTAWGRFWGAQTAAFAVAALAFWAAHRAGRRGAADPGPGATTWIAGAAAVAGAALQAGLGHALADDHAPTLALASAALHVIGVALWLGTLAALAVAWLALDESAAELPDAPGLPRPAAATAGRAGRPARAHPGRPRGRAGRGARGGAAGGGPRRRARAAGRRPAPPATAGRARGAAGRGLHAAGAGRRGGNAPGRRLERMVAVDPRRSDGARGRAARRTHRVHLRTASAGQAGVGGRGGGGRRGELAAQRPAPAGA
jgi:hypothetical protein